MLNKKNVSENSVFNKFKVNNLFLGQPLVPFTRSMLEFMRICVFPLSVSFSVLFVK